MSLSYSDIFAYIGDRKRPLKEGEAVFNADHVVKCGFKMSENNYRIILGVVLQTSALNKSPHEVEIHLKNNPSNWDCKCSCKAGKGGMCKHVVACLIYANRKELENLSCTDLQQSWGKIGKPVQYSTSIPLREYCHVKSSTLNIHTEMETCKQNLELFLQCKPNSALGKLMYGRNTAGNCSKQSFINEANIPNGIASVEEVFNKISSSNPLSDMLVNLFEAGQADLFYRKYVLVTDIECRDIFRNTIGQESAIWKKERKFRLTGSRCYEIFTYNENKTANWQKKVASFVSDGFRGNACTEYGKIQESEAAKCYEAHKGPLLKCGLVISSQHPYLAYSPDGISEDYSTLIEIKCPVIGATESIGTVIEKLSYIFLDEKYGIYTLKKRHKYYGQVQLGMFLLNQRKCDFVIYCSFDKSCVILEIDFDIEFCCTFLKTLKYLYFTKMLPYFKE